MASVSEVEAWLDRLYVATAGATLRQEARKKARELTGLLDEVARAIGTGARRAEVVLVDAAAGKAPVGLLAAALVLAPAGHAAHVLLVERDPRRAEAARTAAALLTAALPPAAAGNLRVEVRCADVADPAAWPAAPDVVVALHACGAASDLVIERATAARARRVLLAPCCVADGLPAARRARAHAAALGIDGHAEVRRRVVQARVDAERVLALEAAGYETVVAPFCAPTVTPHNLVLRARRVGEPVRAERARRALAELRGEPT